MSSTIEVSLLHLCLAFWSTFQSSNWMRKCLVLIVHQWSSIVGANLPPLELAWRSTFVRIDVTWKLAQRAFGVQSRYVVCPRETLFWAVIGVNCIIHLQLAWATGRKRQKGISCCSNDNLEQIYSRIIWRTNQYMTSTSSRCRISSYSKTVSRIWTGLYEFFFVLPKFEVAVDFTNQTLFTIPWVSWNCFHFFLMIDSLAIFKRYFFSVRFFLFPMMNGLFAPLSLPLWAKCVSHVWLFRLSTAVILSLSFNREQIILTSPVGMNGHKHLFVSCRYFIHKPNPFPLCVGLFCRQASPWVLLALLSKDYYFHTFFPFHLSPQRKWKQAHFKILSNVILSIIEEVNASPMSTVYRSYMKEFRLKHAFTLEMSTSLSDLERGLHCPWQIYS